MVKGQENKKIKVLGYMDSPSCATGFATVSRNILEGLYRTGRYEIDICGINFWGDPHNFPYRIWPTGTNELKDPYGRKKSANMMVGMDYDILFLLQDSFILDFAPDVHTYARSKGKNFRSICYYPIDGTPKEQWIKNVNACDHVVAYSQFGKNETLKALPTSKEPLVIPHGVNTKEFFIANEKDIREFRAQYFGSLADKFIFTNLNRNQQRKDIPRTIAAFVEFRKHVKDCVLYLHMAKQDQGWDLTEVIKSYGLNITTDVIFPENFGPNQGYPRQIVNMIYNISDCVLSTSLGEGFGFCLMPETNIYTESGIKYIKDITINDKVLSSDGTFNSVEAIMSKNHDGDVYSITTWLSNIPINSSPEHGFLVLDGDNEYIWKKAKELLIGDQLLFPRKYNEESIKFIDVLSLIKDMLSTRQLSNIETNGAGFRIQSNFKTSEEYIPNMIEITPSLMYLFGLYVAEGSLSMHKKDRITFSFNKKEDHLVEFVKTEMKKVFGLDVSVCNESRGEKYNGISISFYSSVVCSLFYKLFGHGARNKHIHSIILNQPKEYLEKFIYGEFIGDGHYSNKNFEFSFSTTSKGIAYALRHILAKLGVLCSVRTSRVEYKVNVSGISKEILLRLFNMDYPLLDRSKANETCKINDAYLLFPIKNISIQKYTGKLVDVQVANTNTFVAENVVVHNSWIEAMATKTPVIMPDNTMFSEFINEDNGYLVKSGGDSSLYTVLPHDNEVIRPLVDVNDLVEKMLAVYNNKAEAKRRATNAYDWVTTKMDWQNNIAPLWIKLFDKAYDELKNPAITIPNVEDTNVIEAETF